MRAMRTRILIGIAIGATMLAQGTASAATQQRRPTKVEAHWAATKTMTTYAELLDGKLVVSPCVPKGSKSRVCRVRVDGPVPQRFRVIVSTSQVDESGRLFMIRARPLGPASRL